MNRKGIEFDPAISHSNGLLIAVLFEVTLKKALIQPSFIMDFPLDTTPLCKPLREYTMDQLEEMKNDPERVILAERFEPYIFKWSWGIHIPS